MTAAIETLINTHPRIRRFSGVEFSDIYSREPHLSGCHELLCVLHGNMTLHIENSLIFNAIPGDLLLIPEKVMHRDEFVPSKGLRVLFIAFDWQVPEYFQVVTNRELIHLRYEVRSEVQRRLEFLRANWSDDPECRLNAELQLHGMLMLLYNGIKNSAKEETEEKNMPLHDTMRRAKHFVDQNCASPITLEEAAKFVSISPPYFSKLFHSEFGVSFSAYLTAARLNRAKHLLQSTSYQIAEIANLCGFSSSGYFIKVFSRHFGLTPKAYASMKSLAMTYISPRK